MNFCIKNVNIELSAAALLIFAVFVYAERSTELAALAIVVFTHELSHMIALKAFGARIGKISIDLGGLNIGFSGRVSEMGELVSSLAGPAGGLLLAAICKAYGRGELMNETGQMSIFLSVFNLLPVYPLDGGRALSVLLHRRLNSSLCRLFMRIISRTVSTLLLCFGVCLIYSGIGLILIVAALRILMIFDL